ncbi:symmetrical bis(5'-nucleosyl)-tetraphosphatase [Herbaspirillum sp. RTI4]|uniref:symmetrical bis(5'-nucleosyl)-tetraphosphatase n=1 Tax=Herbaspirillum sp. RTI4 TaxID=3048640 RepID=UPI002AB4B9ED|nr:symmetrical bis(5'-nucleosyl)-tetraphosphatase [Herbaspirillum sp. RTI4]MDY7577579.1 symmetrical bis(5'-nucleosyl)-tetraphosphatase [Herbaspirillum sp. RTI4]MEA9981054.1 symmetrical bis(5'-nucleosyl)-tetraphosphatase [Herbaspirillum sp. RTI4]
MPTYAIGDLQGCGQQLEQLLTQLHAATPDPQLIFVGDLVNRGPQSLTTLRLIRSLGARAQMVLGNHDLHLLAVAHGIRKKNKSDTLDDILNAPDRDELLDWLRRQPLALWREGHLFVHAGVLPQWNAAQTVALAAEVQAVLSGPNWLDFLHDMYGDTPAHWDDALQGHARLRCIVNALTRMRFCTPDGTMEFSIKEGAGTAPAGYLPWFDLPHRQSADVTVVFGHWSTLGLTLRPYLLGLDTGCVWGGQLTAIRLSDRALFQVDCPQAQRPG